LLQILTPPRTQTQDAAAREALRARLASGDVAFVTGVGVTDPEAAAFLDSATAALPTALFWDCAPRLAARHRADGFAPAAPGPLAALAARVGWTREGRAAGVLRTLAELWGRHTSDDLLYTWLVVINEYFTVGRRGGRREGRREVCVVRAVCALGQAQGVQNSAPRRGAPLHACCLTHSSPRLLPTPAPAPRTSLPSPTPPRAPTSSPSSAWFNTV
jgi:hypothetical protein